MKEAAKKSFFSGLFFAATLSRISCPPLATRDILNNREGQKDGTPVDKHILLGLQKAFDVAQKTIVEGPTLSGSRCISVH